MPFTPSHALVALPFVRTPLVPAAIAVGAMTPDLPLFVRGVGIGYSFTHESTNVVWTGLIALLLFVTWRVLLRPAVAELSPSWLARRIPDEWSTGAWSAAQAAVGVGARPAYPVLLAVSLLIGVISHITWDAFTHEGRWGLDLIPALAEAWGPLPGYKWVQYGSSVIGLLVLAVFGAVLLVRRKPASVIRFLPRAVRWAWWLSLPAILAAAWMLGLAAFGPLTSEWTPQHLAYRVLPVACAVWGALTMLLCVVVAFSRARHQRG
ncbi:MAG: DUF4184 family protein [Microbacterium sp.]